MNATEAAEFAGLKRDIASLESRVVALETGAAKRAVTAPKAPARRLDQADVRITILADDDKYQLPNDAEMRKLYEIALRRLPALGVQPGADEEEFFRSFCGAFRYLGNKGRAAEINKKYSLSWWVGACARWCDDHRIGVPLNGPAFIAAVVAMGDIGYVIPDPSVGAVWEFALESYGGRPVTDAWRKVLRGELLTPWRPSGLPAQSPAEVKYF
jgi:hypothetical protein